MLSWLSALLVAEELGRLPALPGGGARWSAQIADTARDNDVRVEGLGADGAQAWRLAATVRGSLAPDWVWLGASAQAEAAEVAGASSREGALAAQLTAAPAEHHRVRVEVGADPGAVDGLSFGVGRGRLSWLGELGPDAAVDVVGAVARRWVGGAHRDTVEVRSGLNARVGALGLGVGAGAARFAWDDGARATLLTAFAQDQTQIGRVLVSGGVRVEAWENGAWGGTASPRVFARWDVTGDARTSVHAGLARYVEPDRLLPGQDPPLSDVAHLAAARKLGPWWVRAVGQVGRSTFPFALPPAQDVRPEDVEREERAAGRVELVLVRPEVRRWSMEVAVALAAAEAPDPALLLDPRAPFVPAFLDVYRKRAARAQAEWALPTDPWTARVEVHARWADAAGTGAWWLAPVVNVGGSWAQEVPVRGGRAFVRAGAAWVANDLGDTVLPLQAFAVNGQSLEVVPRLRLTAHVEAAF